MPSIKISFAPFLKVFDDTYFGFFFKLDIPLYMFLDNDFPYTAVSIPGFF
jgi:hypothetical protein